jgi:serine protease Do
MSRRKMAPWLQAGRAERPKQRWKIAAFAVALAAAASIGATVTPAAEGQTVRVRTPRVLETQAFELFGGGSRIGVSIRDIEAEDAKTTKGASSGVIVDDVSAESPAEKAGIRKSDVIVEFDGERVRSVRQLTRLVQETPSGRTVRATLLRDGQRQEVSVVPREGSRYRFDDLGELSEWGRDLPYKIAPRPPTPPAPPSPPAAWKFDQFFGGSNARLGITVDALSSQLAEYFGTKDGVLVTSVSADSVAAKAGLKAGDVITAINGSPVDEPADVRRRIQELEGGAEFTIAVMRDRKAITLKGTLESQRRTRRSIL